MQWRRCLWIWLSVTVLLGLAVVGATITVNPGQDIQAAINSANVGDTIQLSAGTYDVTSTILINKAVTVSGAGATVRGTAAGALCVFELSASGAVLHSVDVTWSTLLETWSSTWSTTVPEVADSLVRVVGTGLSGVSITDNVIHVPAQAGAMKTWVARALTVADSACSSAVVISGNTVYNTRNGVVVRSNNSATISDNLIYATKGGIMNYTGSLADAARRTMTNNTWGTAHSEWDIVWNTFAYFTPDYQQSVIALSSLNNGAYVVDRRAKDKATCDTLTGNRSHLFVSATGTAAAGPAAGNPNEPFPRISLGVDAVTPGGVIYVSPGAYAGNVIVYKDGVTLKSVGGPAATVIDASLVDKSGYKNQWGKGINYSWAETYDPGLLRNGFLVWSDNVTLDGFAVVNAAWPTYNRGIAVLIGSIDTTYAGFIPWNIDQWGGLISPVDRPTPTGVTIRNMLIVGPTDGIYLWSSSGNTIEGNTIQNTSPLGGAGIIVYQGGTGNVIQGNSVQNAAGDAVAICGVWPDGFLDVGGTQVLSNDLLNSANGLKFYNVADPDGKGVVALYNVIWGNVNGIIVEGGRATVPHAHYNSIVGNTGFGAVNTDTTGNFDASLNWWGDASGPSGEGLGSGDAVSTNVIYSPWLGTNPDGNPGSVGVQVVAPMLIVVAPVGPEPTGGYLNAAIVGSNSTELPYADTIEVRHGTYTYSTAEPITEGATLISETGSALHTKIDGPLALESDDVVVGLPLRGFTFLGDIDVLPPGAGLPVDASTIHINWNDIYATVTNSANGTLDAEFNYWGTLEVAAIEGRTLGDIDFDPYLPKNADDSYNDVVTLLNAGAADDLYDAVALLSWLVETGRSLDGYLLTFEAGHGADSAWWSSPAANLSAQITLGAGAGGGGGVEGVPTMLTVGEAISGTFSLTDPATGLPIDDAIVTVSLIKTNADGETVFVGWALAAYDASTGKYTFELATEGLAPGKYELIFQTNAGQTVTMEVELT